MPDFKKIKKLGEGFFGEVWLVYDRAVDKERCVKFIPPHKITDPTNFYSEPKTLINVKHENIVEVIDAGTESNGSLYIVMEYLENGSIEDVYSSSPIFLSRACKFLTDICRGLEFAHSKGYIHRDIKPANILLDKNGNAKLSDFGLATSIPKGTCGSPKGYRTHFAPEVLTKNETNILTDIYALGVTAYRLINGDAYLETPSSITELYNWIIKGKYPNRNHYRPYVPQKLIKIINKSLEVNALSRIQSASEFRHLIESVEIFYDWSWKHKRKKVIYKSIFKTPKIFITISKKINNKFDIITQKKTNNSVKRCVNKDCFYDVIDSKRRSVLHKLLARYTSKGV